MAARHKRGPRFGENGNGRRFHFIPRARPRHQRPVPGTEVFSETHSDSGDFYSAAGAFEFRDTFREVEHMTVTNDVVRVDRSKGHLHFFGDC